MFHDYLQVYKLSIVLVGEFNPAIVQPFWLANKKLIREGEANSANVEIIHNDVAKIDLDWVTLEVTKQRFELHSSQEPYFELVKDLAVSIFEILKETPISAFGINHIKNFALRDEDQYYSFGDKLVPLNNWSGFLSNPRLFNLEILQADRMDGLNGKCRIRIGAAEANLKLKYGVAVHINDHYDLIKEKQESCKEMVEILSDRWTKSSEDAKHIIESLWNKINL